MKYGGIYEVDQRTFAHCMLEWKPRFGTVNKTLPTQYSECSPEDQDLWRRGCAAEILKHRCGLIVRAQDITLWDEFRKDIKCIRVKFVRHGEYKTTFSQIPPGAEFPLLSERSNPDPWPSQYRDEEGSIYPERALYMGGTSCPF